MSSASSTGMVTAAQIASDQALSAGEPGGKAGGEPRGGEAGKERASEFEGAGDVHAPQLAASRPPPPCARSKLQAATRAARLKT